MNKDLIKKYKKEFDHWLKGGNILVRYPNAVSPVWETEETLATDFIDPWDRDTDEIEIIIDDKYVELRKALVEGKQIQLFNNLYDTSQPSKTWIDVETIYDAIPLIKYRIKPDESKFKVDDYVTTLVSYRDRDIIRAPALVKEIKTNGGMTLIFEPKVTNGTWGDYCSYVSGGKDVKLWQPKLNDVVILLDQPTPRISKITNLSQLLFVIDEFKKKRVIPYIGQPLEKMK